MYAACALSEFRRIISVNARAHGDSATGGMSYSSLIFQVGESYSVTIQAEYHDGSTSTINTSVIAQS